MERKREKKTKEVMALCSPLHKREQGIKTNQSYIANHLLLLLQRYSLFSTPCFQQHTIVYLY